ncbi:phosphomannomutase [uncultured Devosia sp.]|uniref:phosphomannomutase n=1 Tax=uncultured Devosia sp. TaxID=211434 RepID=UPI00260D4172|nr:phosphomannomutase [uncultured Devosia sp.]
MTLGGSLKFGTSGLRGLAAELEGQAARQYTTAFLRHLDRTLDRPVQRVFLARDFRPSSQAILQDCAVAIVAAGLEPVDCGALPTPALALHAMADGGAAIMVTGSHIPADRNGLKFYLPSGEIGKQDEAGILAALDRQPIADGEADPNNEVEPARRRYLKRCLGILPDKALAGKRIGVFQHSTVARDLIFEVLAHYGAEVVPLGRIEGFVPVDTEAFSDAIFAPIPGWIGEHGLDAVVSADGDGDRPLVVDERGTFIRGDVLGLMTARYLGADCVVTPVTSNTAIEDLDLFNDVERTRVGSPYVVASMNQTSGATIGFEANGGTFVGQGITAPSGPLDPLVTRDAILPIVCALGESARLGQPLSQVVAQLPLKSALADRLQDIPSERSAAFLDRLRQDPDYAGGLFGEFGISRRADIDGLQFWTSDGDMVHFRASGNAPELRCYVEASAPAKARELLKWGLEVAARETRL